MALGLQPLVDSHHIADSSALRLGAWMLLTSTLGNWGLFAAELLEDSYQLLGMVEMGLAPAFLGGVSARDTPVRIIMLQSVIPDATLRSPPPHTHTHVILQSQGNKQATQSGMCRQRPISATLQVCHHRPAGLARLRVHPLHRQLFLRRRRGARVRRPDQAARVAA